MCDLMTDTARLAAEGTAFETVTWLPYPEHRPDADITVLVAVAGEPDCTWLGWLNDENHWVDASTGAVFLTQPTHFADMPAGPQA